MNTNGNKKTGSVMVLGGGIAGVQSALDLADSGFQVHLIERSAAIGGMMSQLDKTFPTGDCATCIVSPKLVECARNLNIKIHTLSELTQLEGEPGNFTATILKNPRYVDEDKCTSCSQCEDACPVHITDSFNRQLGTRKAIAKHYAQAVPNIFGIQKIGHAPCKMHCPAKINVQGYIQLIKKKEYVKAVALIRERNPLSAVCGRVCNHPCEDVCTRRNVDSPVAIRLLKRFASDREYALVKSGELAMPEEKQPLENAKTVAIIGAGPAGLTAARDLADLGYAPVIYEASSAAGGMLRWGIPDYRLPPEILDFEVELIRRHGVSFHYNCRVGKDVALEQLQQENAALFVATGVQKSIKLDIPGENLKGVHDGLDFLYQSNNGEQPEVGKEVAVIGGGDVALDGACSAVRYGPDKVSILYRRSAKEMPASREEIDQAGEEGISIQYLTAPIEFLDDGTGCVRAVKCMRMKLGQPDESGRRRPEPVPGSEFEVTAQTVIVAIGSIPETIGNGLPVGKWGNLEADSNCVTDVDGVFAGGDIVTGASTAIEAIAAGKRAAESIDRYIKDEAMTGNRFEDSLKPVPEDSLPDTRWIKKEDRAKNDAIRVKKRANNFLEVQTGCSETDALREAERCLNCALCSECRECSNTCEQDAIQHSMKPQVRSIQAGSVILAPGFEDFNPEIIGEFGFNRYPNVITSVQFERMLSASGPFEGHVVRRSDGKSARRIAWIQCVGSRDSKCGNDYCSSICCMASTKQALVAREHIDEMEAAIFYMDIRAHGKDFDQYYERARSSDNINYIKSIPSRLLQVPQSGDLQVQFVDGHGALQTAEFDLIILSVGMEPGERLKKQGELLGLALNRFGFCATSRFAPVSTSRPGVFVAGAFQEPKDIPETVTQASAAASMSMALLAPSRNTLTVKHIYPAEHDIEDEEPRIGVFICHCGINIAGVVDVKRVAGMAALEAGVVYATHTVYACSDTSLSEMRRIVDEHRLNRVVVASCTPRTHEPLFRETLREGGRNPYLFEMANIRDQCSWVHSSEPEKATDKALDLMRMSVARARAIVPLEGSSIPVNQAGVVIGGGLSGMTAALALADQGFNTHLIEKSDVLGGNLLNISSTLEGDDVSSIVQDLVRRVKTHEFINLHLSSRITSLSGHIGHFKLSLSERNTDKTVTAGAVIVATGGRPALTAEYQYGQRGHVITQLELEKKLHDRSFQVSGCNIVMIQCVGSRNEEHPYCSRLCCSMAVKNALTLKKQDPDAKIYVLYRDIRTYGFRETFYKDARDAGVVFIKYTKDNQPVLSSEGKTVTVNSPDFPEPVEIETDYVVLSTGIEAEEGNKTLSDMLKVPLNAAGFYVEAHLKLRPVDFATEGVFLCGLAHSPKQIDENISQAKAAASRASTVLSKTELDISAQISQVDQSKCISCMTCVKVCPYSAPGPNKDGKAEIEAAKCMGCGICVSECPAQAIQLNHFNSAHFNSMIDTLFSIPENRGK